MAAHDLDSLRTHIGHRIVCVGYGDSVDPANVAVECDTCGCVLIDFDKDEAVDDEERTQG